MLLYSHTALLGPITGQNKIYFYTNTTSIRTAKVLLLDLSALGPPLYPEVVPLRSYRSDKVSTFSVLTGGAQGGVHATRQNSSPRPTQPTQSTARAQLVHTSLLEGVGAAAATQVPVTMLCARTGEGMQAAQIEPRAARSSNLATTQHHLLALLHFCKPNHLH